jgi:hypothetical protein
VPVGEPSVLVGTAAPHRRAALSATDWLVDELKRRVPIWKKVAFYLAFFCHKIVAFLKEFFVFFLS